MRHGMVMNKSDSKTPRVKSLDDAILAVEDTGVGITPDHQDKVFERFYRVSPDRGESGAGLGLAIVKSIVHAHGGNVVLRSKPGLGSAFRIELPLLSVNLAGPSEAPENIVAAAGAAAATGKHGSPF